ncbi:MAG: sulfatase [Chloroflexota bacterium]|nr:sulfatase [Chloroflexota bacterium]
MNSAKRPNLLILYPDQWRFDVLGSAGDPVIQSPNLDRLARQGLRLTYAFVASPLCTPSRGSLMTGRYPHKTGVMHNESPLPVTETGFAEPLRAAGYRTGYIGKWHLDGEARPGFVPPERRHGWDYWAGFNRGHRYFDGVYFHDTATERQAVGFEPDHQTDLAIAFLEQSARERESHFCLMVSWGPPHTPRDPPLRHQQTYTEQQFALSPSVPTELHETARHERVGYYGLCTAIDDNVGRLLRTLDQLELADDTIVLFTSDHGDSLGEHGLFRKTIPYDESTRVPFIIRWPEAIAADVTSDALCHSVDVAPTLLSLCGVPAPAMQGYDLSSALSLVDSGPRSEIYMEGEVGKNTPWGTGANALHALPDEWRALRTHEHLICTDVDGTVFLLFDVSSDPLALKNLAGHPEWKEVQDTLLTRIRETAHKLEDHIPLGFGPDRTARFMNNAN